MAEPKTKLTTEDPRDFLSRLDDEAKKADSFALLELFEKVTKEPSRMWGPSIVGYGMYHYKSERSKQEGDWPIAAFSPRKQTLTVYVMMGLKAYGDLLSRLGKHKTSKACLYFKRLSDIDIDVLAKIIEISTEEMRRKYGL